MTQMKRMIGKMRILIFPAWALNLVWLSASIFIYHYTKSTDHWSEGAWAQMCYLAGGTKIAISILAAVRCFELFTMGETERPNNLCAEHGHDYKSDGIWKRCQREGCTAKH